MVIFTQKDEERLKAKTTKMKELREKIAIAEKRIEAFQKENEEIEERKRALAAEQQRLHERYERYLNESYYTKNQLLYARLKIDIGMLFRRRERTRIAEKNSQKPEVP